MRSNLIACNTDCALADRCRHCADLGYRAQNSIASDDIVRRQKMNLTEIVVFPCSSHLRSDFANLVLALRQQKKQVKFVFLFEYWDNLSPQVKELFLAADVAVVHTSMQSAANMNFNHTNYFLASRGTWSFQGWEMLSDEHKSRLNLFFPPNQINQTQNFKAEEALDLAKQIISHFPLVNFDYPFGHDQVDNRNPDHMSWFLSPAFEEFSVDFHYCSPQISVVIPFHNRTKLLAIVIQSLSRQTLNKSDFEIVLIDDGSDKIQTDQLREIAGQYPQLAIRLAYVTRNVSLTGLYVGNRVGPIRNLGANLSRADILLFLDSDIILDPTYLEFILQKHATHDVILPRRIYLDKATSDNPPQFEEITSSNHMQASWTSYLDDFYSRSDWQNEPLPWKYTMTYCLSVTKKLFLQSGGFRSNYISYGYEDLDWGYRLMKLSPKLLFLDRSVFHLFHFDKANEYDLNLDFRRFQLALTSRTFVLQNMPVDADYLIQMVQIKGFRQNFLFYYFKLLWGWRKARLLVQRPRSNSRLGSEMSA